jgi:uncharacterized protein
VANRLSEETSPYLLQHAHNPVDWYPWGDEAFAEAVRRQVPVLLSVGYSACHWCHVMERESFENPLIAARMNSLFVNVKVDREERPDVDELYMRAVQAFNRGQGGWPMTVFLTPEGVPFFGGTYFPPVSRAGLPGLADVLTHVSEIWRRQPEQIEDVTKQIVELLAAPASGPSRMLSREWLPPVAAAAAEDQDPVHGGFGGAPKFPPHGTLAALLAHHRRTGDAGTLAIVTRTLDAMAKGGMYDLVGGGFCRYSVDAEWRVPHFEKMLYDTAQLVPIYVDAWRVTGRERYATVVRESIGWALREMQLEALREGAPSPEGGAFASSLDADTDGQEGAFYVFTPEQLTAALGDAAGMRVASMLEVTPEGTFEGGASVLRLEAPRDELAPGDAAVLADALPKLRALRDTRTPPARDDKRIVAWNALMISALARAGAAMDEPDWIAAAVGAWDNLAATAVVDGRWMRTVKDGRANVPAFADDHANLLVAALDLYEATFEARWVSTADAIAGSLLELFWDEEQQALTLAGRDQPKLFAPGRPAVGGAEPGAGAMAALGLVRLARLMDRQAYADRAEQILRAAQPWLTRAPRAIGYEALAGAWLAGNGAEIAIVGPPEDPATAALLAEVRQRYLPFTVVACVPTGGATLLPWLEGKDAVDGRPTAYLCEGHTCQLPTHDPDILGAQLEERMLRALPITQNVGNRVEAPELPDAPEAWLGLEPGSEPPTLARLRGHVVVLDFWTHCCINCLHVLPELRAIEERFAGEPVAVIGVHCAKFPAEEIAENVRRAMQRHGVHHPVLHDPAHAIWEEYAVRSWPTIVVIDPEGRIALHQPGETGREELGRVVASLLAEGRSRGTLAERAVLPVPAADAGEELRFPGKVHVWPDAFEQEMGADPYLDGWIYVSDTGHHRILGLRLERGADGWPRAVRTKVWGAGEPGLVDGPGETAQFRSPQGVRRFERTLFVADTENHALRAIDLETDEVRTLAGTGRKAVAAPTREELARPLELDLRSPWDVEVMPMRHHQIVFVAMAGSHQLWVYGGGHMGMHTGSGREDHVDGPAAASALAQPSALALLGRYLLFVDAETSSIRAVDLQSHQVVTVVGRGLFDFGDVDGPADEVRLQHPLGLTFIGDTIYVADTFNGKIKAVGLQSGETHTLCGGDGSLADPGGIARVGSRLLVADTDHHRIRVVDPADGSARDLEIVDA